MVGDEANSPATQHDKQVALCENCGTNLADRYCARCGQDAHANLSIRHFLGEFVEGMFHFDSTFWRTFLPLLFKPGLLTQQYLSGRRKSYAPPVRSYLVLSLIYFAIASLVAPMQARFIESSGEESATQTCAQFAVEVTWLRHLVPDVAGACKRVLKDEGHGFSNALQGMLPKVMFAVLPLVALIQYGLWRRRRRWYVENLIFILHFQSFYFFAGALALLLAACITVLLNAIGWPSQDMGDSLDFLLYAWSACYLFVANRRVYGAGVIKAGFSVATIALAYMVFWVAGVALAALYEFARA
jgi:Protein of unknown function (DUF3667)